MNLGIHFFDVLGWVFGTPRKIEVDWLTDIRGSGIIEFEGATAEWFISSSADDLPEGSDVAHRVFEIDGRAVADASKKMDALHTRVYRAALADIAPRAQDAKLGVEMVYEINQQGGLPWR